jgi:pimeloyl-ACP methyl ester carboxylesterase
MLLIGSSMGGWIALHLALLRPERVCALIGIAAAPDFTDWGFTTDQAAKLDSSSKPTRAFWESGQQLRLLGNEIAVDCPVRLLHGERDEEVPLDVAFRLMRAIRSADIQLNVLKGGGHRLSGPHEIRAILNALEALLEPEA